VTIDNCRPGLEVATPFGRGTLLHPVPRTHGHEWLVYADGKAYPVDVDEISEPDDEQPVQQL